MNKQEREQIKRVAEGFADATKCVFESMHDVNEHPSFAKALMKNFHAIDDLEQRVTKLEQGYKAAQSQENIKPVELPQDVQDFINRVCVCDCKGIRCCDCLYGRNDVPCLVGIARELFRKYVVKD